MRFQVPQFTEQETKVAGPLTFKQFLFMGLALLVVIILYLTLAKKSFMLFLFTAGMAVFCLFSLAFLKVQGRSMPTLLGNFLGFFIGSKMYLWKKKELPPRIVWKKESEIGKISKSKSTIPDLKIVKRSRLKQAAANIEARK